MLRIQEAAMLMPELFDPTALEDSKSILQGLSKQDWAFTDDDTRYLTHDLHPYPAKFIPQIPARLITHLSVRGDVVFDPFGGSATTAVEAVRLGRRAVSLDANPLSALIGRVKSGFMTPAIRAELEQLLATVESHALSRDARRSVSSEALTKRYSAFVPDVPNLGKWFTATVTGELALLRFLIEETTKALARDAALIALSRIIIRVSNQESETRYVAVTKAVTPGLTLKAFLESLRMIIRRLETASIELQYADANFIVGDSRKDIITSLGENAVDLIVTSPPYPNATDYHLYHRFRLFWLGFDPRKLGQIEIGSHLRHQRNGSGFEEYCTDIKTALEGCVRVLQPGRYAVFVVGDAVFSGKLFSTADALIQAANEVGFTVVGIINRPIHQTKRSFAQPARRARSEQLVVLQKPNKAIAARLFPPGYKMWPFEEKLRQIEVEQLTGESVPDAEGDGVINLELRQPAIWNLRRLTFSREYALHGDLSKTQPTWQKVLENGDAEVARRKDPKYATHGLHSFKGKFYPQLAKALLNISGAPLGGRVFDPYCGSGTFLLEGMLNGFAAHGCDFNPLAAKIARAKTEIFTVHREVADLSMRTLLERLSRLHAVPMVGMEQFKADTREELIRWFPKPVLHKLNWVLGQARLFGEPALVDFFEVIISSIIRDVSHQDPTDLRVRRRKNLLEDAPVLELFRAALEQQHKRLLKYWHVAGRQPGQTVTPRVMQGDSRKAETLELLGLPPGSVDCVVTSPPYATALPYIDTDRLSLLAVMGLTSGIRAELEENLTGSREIRRADKERLEFELMDRRATQQLPRQVVQAIRRIYITNQNDEVGFRRANMGALLWRYFMDMRDNLTQVAMALKPGAKAYYVVGDSRTNTGGKWVAIETCKNISAIAEMVGLQVYQPIQIDVTTENYKHIKNAITENQILVFEKS